MDFRKIDKNILDSIARIYKTEIKIRNATFETNVPSLEEWDKKHLRLGFVLPLWNMKICWAGLPCQKFPKDVFMAASQR
ncbi:hypothetical protein SAMN05421636_1042 [Pricia antarctica]|uniref:Uncharacterized protein n=1 Tax=Pricia antarctica TaxID=641691 RepID=A0A1G7B4N5_9FLAO|nr:hypothetical protein SAMN05421636_1042 [Pricia antarctica]